MLYFYPSSNFFNSSDVKKYLFTHNDLKTIKSIPHVAKVIEGLYTHERIGVDLSKCLPRNDTEYLINWLATLYSMDYNMSIEDAKQYIIKEGKKSGDVESYIHNLVMGFTSKSLDILVINTTELDSGVIFYFNDIYSGEFLNGIDQIVIGKGYEGLFYVYGNSVITCKDKINVGDTIYWMFPANYGYSYVPLKVVGYLSPNRNAQAVVGYDTLYHVLFSEAKSIGITENAKDFINKLGGLYSILFIIVDDPANVKDVGDTIMKLYPNAGVWFKRYSAEIAHSMIENAERSYSFITYSSIISMIAFIALVRFIEVSRAKKEIGLLRAFGWTNKEIMTYMLIYAGLIGLIAGLISDVSLLTARPYIIEYLSTPFKSSFYIRNLFISEIKNISLTPFLILNILVGVVISIIVGFTAIIYYTRITPSETIMGS